IGISSLLVRPAPRSTLFPYTTLFRSLQFEGRPRSVAVDEIEGTGEDAGGRRLAHAAHAGEDEGMVDAPGGESVAQGAHHCVLPDQIVKACRPVLPGEHDIGRGRLGHQRQIRVSTRRIGNSGCVMANILTDLATGYRPRMR